MPLSLTRMLSHPLIERRGKSCTCDLMVSTTISPRALILTTVTCKPAATTALTALVTSFCRKVDGVRAMSPPLRQ